MGKTTRRPEQAPIGRDFPCEQTLFRINLYDRHIYRALRKVPAGIKPLLLVRDREAIDRVKEADTGAALLDVAPLAIGLLERTWEDRTEQLEPEVLPLIVERLQQSRRMRDADAQTRLREMLIAHLRWRGDAGAGALLAAFDALDDYSRSLACVVLGLLKAGDAVGPIWNYYQRVARNPRESYFVGALRGLADLKDERTGTAVVELLQRGHAFYERFGFAALAGDEQAIGPLFQTLARGQADEPEDVVMAIAAIGHSIGREKLSAEIARIMPASRPPEEAGVKADQIQARTASDVEEYFSLYLRGPTRENIAGATEG